MKKGILRALGDGTRFKLLSLISEGEICACELPSKVRVSQPAVSQHLKVLLKAGLVSMRKDGSNRLYSISKKGIMVLKDISRW